MSRYLLSAVVCMVGWPALAQVGAIQWQTDPQQAVSQAERANLPLMVYVLGASSDRDNKIEREQRRALADERVVQLAQSFVPLRLSRSQHADVLADFGLDRTASMMMSFVTPKGERLGTLPADGVARADVLARKLVEVYLAYGRKLYTSEIKPVLENPGSKPNDLKTALRAVNEFHITAADQAVIALLERPKLSAELKKLACDALAGLSTKAAVEKLVESMRQGDKNAGRALENCTPEGADLLLAQLKADDANFDYPLYKIIAKICGHANTRPAKFFEGSDVKARTQELERLRQTVQEAVRQWRETHGGPG